MNFGGAVATAGGVIFIAATADEKIRAFEKHSGRVSVGVSSCRRAGMPRRASTWSAANNTSPSRLVAVARTPRSRATRSSRSPCPDEASTGHATSRPKSDWIDLFDGSTLNGWVAPQRRSHLHRRGWRHRRADGRKQCGDEFVSLQPAGVRQLRARARNDDRPGHQLGDSDQDRGSTHAGQRERQRVRSRAGCSALRLKSAASTKGNRQRAFFTAKRSVRAGCRRNRKSMKDIRTSSMKAGTSCGSWPRGRAFGRG